MRRAARISRNPLGRMAEHEGEGGGARGSGFQDYGAPTAASTRFTRLRNQSPPLAAATVEGWDDREGVAFSGSRWERRQASVVSSPPGAVAMEMVARPTCRSHSLPTGEYPHAFQPIPEESSATPTSGSTASGRRPLRLSRQDSIHDDALLEEVSASSPSPTAIPSSAASNTNQRQPLPLHHPPLPPPLPQAQDDQSPEADLAHRYIRGSSLEPIQPPVPRVPREPDNKRSTRDRLREKFGESFEWMKNYFGTLHFDPTKELAHIPEHSSFFIIDHNNRFRKLCFKLVKSSTFHAVSYMVILLSSVVLMLEIPIGVREEEQFEFCAVQRIIIWVDITILVFFVIEMLLKMISLGVIVHRNSYLRNFFNMVDFLVTILTLVPIIYYLVQYQDRNTDICISYGYDRVVPTAVGTLRVMRVLRPLRAFRIGGLYLAVSGLLSSFKAMGSIFFIDSLVVIIFAIMGVHFFKGSFYFCTDPSIETEDECVGYFFKYDYTFGFNLSVPGLTCPVAEQREWTQHSLHFDNVGNAILTLFTMLTAEGWQNVMYSGINSRQPLDSMTPLASIMENNLPAALYFILYMIFMTFIMVQLFVGFIIVTFQEVGVKTFRKTKLDRNQFNCLHFALTKRPRQQWQPKYKVKRLLPWIDSLPVRLTIFILLLFNTIILCAQIDGEAMEKKLTLYYINAVCTVLFAFEAIMKLLILTPPIYFRDIWNTFSFLVALGSVIELIVQRVAAGIEGYDVMMLEYSHIVSSLRILRLLEFIPRVKRILWTVIRSLEIFPWVGYLLVIIIYTYAIIGMHVFGTVERATVDESEEKGIHQYNHFATFPNAILLMCRVITGENWQDVMINCLGNQPCDNSTHLFSADEESDCGSHFAYFFFVSFYFLSTIMILNLFVAVIMDHFEYIVWDKSHLGAYNLRVFVKQWAKYDPEGRGKLKFEEVFDMLRRINPPIGWGKLCPRITAYKKMMHLNIPIVEEEREVEGVKVKDKMVSFNSTLFAIVRSSLEIDCKGCPDCKRKCNGDMRKKLETLFPNMSHNRFDKVLAKEADATVSDEYAALLVQAEWRSFVRRRKKIVDIFQGSERKLLVHREVQDPGPDLIKSRPLSTFNHDLEMLEIPTNPRKASESSYSSGTTHSHSRMGSHSPRSQGRSPIYSPMPLLEPSGLEFLNMMEPLSPTYAQYLQYQQQQQQHQQQHQQQQQQQRNSNNAFAFFTPPPSQSLSTPLNASPAPRPLFRAASPPDGDSPFFAGRMSSVGGGDGDDVSFASALSHPSPSHEELDKAGMETTI